MIGIGTIGRAAESGGGSTTNQNGKYIAFVLFNYGTSPSQYTLYCSDDFGATFKTRSLPITDNIPIKVHINYLGEIMIVYSSSLYYAASPTSNWVLIENQHTNSKCVVSWDFNTIVYVGDNTRYYISTDKGLSFTSKSIVGSRYSINSIDTIVMSGDGTKVGVKAYSDSAGSNIIIVINSITGTYITDSFSSGRYYTFEDSNYYGNYFTGYNPYEPYTSYIKHLTTYSLYSLNGTYARLAEPSDNGWYVEYVESDNTIRFYNLPSNTQYKSITPPRAGVDSSSGPISGDYVYFSSVPSGATYANIYKVDNIAGHSYELINQINFGISTFVVIREAVSKVPPTLLI